MATTTRNNRNTTPTPSAGGAPASAPTHTPEALAAALATAATLDVSALFALCEYLAPRDALIARMLLAQSRIQRVMNWGPPKGGKTTSVLACAAGLPAPIRVLSVDHDLKPMVNVEWRLLPVGSSIKTREHLSKLHDAFYAAVDEAEGDLKSGRIAGVVLDTISTMYDVFDRLMVRADPAFGVGASTVSNMRARGPQARACGGMVSAILALREAARESPLDCPIILAITEHARQITEDMDKGFTHIGWTPRIAGAAGANIFGQVDIQQGFSVDAEPDKRRSYKVLYKEHGAVGFRMTAAEMAIYAAAMDKVSNLTRFGDALREIWQGRKAAWLAVWSRVLAGESAEAVVADLDV